MKTFILQQVKCCHLSPLLIILPLYRKTHLSFLPLFLQILPTLPPSLHSSLFLLYCSPLPAESPTHHPSLSPLNWSSSPFVTTDLVPKNWPVTSSDDWMFINAGEFDPVKGKVDLWSLWGVEGFNQSWTLLYHIHHLPLFHRFTVTNEKSSLCPLDVGIWAFVKAFLWWLFCFQFLDQHTI